MKNNILKKAKLPIYVAVGIISLVLPLFLGRYDAHILMLALINIILGVSLNFTIGYLGQPNFGHSASFGIGAYTSAILTVNYHVSFQTSILSGLVIGLISGYLLGYISLQLRGAYFAMVSVAITQVLMLLSGNLIGLTGGPMGISGIHIPNLFGLKLGNYGLWLASMIILIAMLIFTKLFNSSVIGRAWIAIRESEILARSIGIDSFKYALLAYIVGSAFASVGGSIYAHYIGYLDPGIFAFAWSSVAVVSVVIGGKGLILGPILGGLVVTLLPEYFRIATLWRLPIFGLVVILIVLFLPNGLLSITQTFSSKPTV